MQTSQTLWLTSPVFPSHSRCSQVPLELSKALAHAVRAISYTLESTCSYGGAFKMLWYLPCRMVKFGISWDLCAGQMETLRVAERLQCSSEGEFKLDAVFSQQWFLRFQYTQEISCIIHLCLTMTTSAKNNSVQAKWLPQSGCGPSEPSETSQWRLTPCPASMPLDASHIALPSQFPRFFLLCQSTISNKHCGIEGQLWPYVGLGSLGTHLHQDCNAMGDAAKTSPRIPPTCSQIAILFLLIIHIIPNRQIYVAIDNPSLVPSVSWLTSNRYLWNYVCAADDVSHAKNLQNNCCRCFSHLYEFPDGIQVTRVSCIVVSARAHQDSTKAPSSFRSLIAKSRFSCHGRRPFRTQ